MKQLKYLLTMALAAFAIVSCVTGTGYEDDLNGPAQEDKLTLTANKSMIYADGTDYAQLTVKFGNRELGYNDIQLLYSSNNAPVPVSEDLKFSTVEVGKHTFFALYTDEKGNNHASPRFSIDAREASSTGEGIEVNLDDIADPNPDKNDISLRASTQIYEAKAERVYFVVRYNGIVVRDPDAEQDFGKGPETISYEILDYETMRPVDLESVVEVRNGENYRLFYYSADKAETRSFFVQYNALNNYKTPVTVKAVEMAIPPRPTDPQPDSYDFKHRAMIMQFTGLGCTWCPQMIAALDDIFNEEGYDEYAVLAVAHTYSNDPFAPDENLGIMASGYPYVNIDFTYGFSNGGYVANKNQIMAIVDNIVAEPAKAGISASMAMNGNSLIVRMTVKAAETNKFRVGAWLLEDGLYGKQTNGSMPDDGTYDFNTHNNVVRKAHSTYSSANFTGYDLNEFAELEAGSEGDYVFDFTIDPSWKQENCHLVLFVTVPNNSGSGYIVTNAIRTESLVSTVSYEYN